VRLVLCQQPCLQFRESVLSSISIQCSDENGQMSYFHLNTLTRLRVGNEGRSLGMLQNTLQMRERS